MIIFVEKWYYNQISEILSGMASTKRNAQGARKHRWRRVLRTSNKKFVSGVHNKFEDLKSLLGKTPPFRNPQNIK